MTTSIESAAAKPPRRCDSGSCIQVDIYEGEHLAEPLVRVRSTETGTVMQVRYSEWVKFVTEINDGEWNHVVTDMEIALARHAAAKMTFTPEERDGVGTLIDATQLKAR